MTCIQICHRLRVYLLYYVHACTSKQPFLIVQYVYLAGTFVFQCAGVTSKCLLSSFLEKDAPKCSLTLTVQNPVQTHYIESCISFTFVQDFLLPLPISPLFGENRVLFLDLVAGICWSLSCGHSGARRSGNTLDCIEDSYFFALTLLSCHAWQIAEDCGIPAFYSGPVIGLLALR